MTAGTIKGVYFTFTGKKSPLVKKSAGKCRFLYNFGGLNILFIRFVRLYFNNLYLSLL